MAAEWESCTVGDVLELTPGFAFKSKDFVEAGTPVIKIKNVKAGEVVFNTLSYVDPSFVESRSNYLIRHGDLLITLSGNRFDGSKETWVGKVAQFRRSGHHLLNQRVAIMRPKDGVEVDDRCLAYILGSTEYQHLFISIATSSGGQANLSSAQVLGAPMRLPPIEDQRAIASILGALDDKIELNRRMNATLESLARAIFKSWFVDFDPVRMKSEGRPLTSETSAPSPVTLPPEIHDLFPSTFQNSELGDIPTGWSVQSLADMSDLLSGGTPKKSIDAYWNGDLPWISPKAMMTLHAFDSNDHVTDEAVGNGTRLVPRGTVLVMVRGMGLHQGVRISQARRDVTFNQDVKALVPTTVNGDFLLFAMLDAASYLFGKVQASGHGTGVIPTDIIQSLRFAVPPIDILAPLTDYLTNINCRIHANTMESSTLSTLRDTLLPKLLSSELPVPAALTATQEALA